MSLTHERQQQDIAFKLNFMKKITLFFIIGFGLNSYSQATGGGMTDINGNTYNTVIIGAQEWTKENLNVSNYTDGTPIPEVADTTQWANLTTGAWFYYNNDPTSSDVYGKLYNWYAVAGIYDAASLDNPALRKQFAPTGWHVPTDPEWSTLINYLDPSSNGGATTPNIAGGKMKSTGTIQAGNGLWNDPNGYATNESGFSGLPAEYRNSFGTFIGINSNAIWWSSSERNTTNAWTRNLNCLNGNAYRGYVINSYGLSVRLINNISLNNQSFNNNSFNIYPNPAKEQITIDLGNNSNIVGWDYKIVNTLGQEVIKGKIASQQTTINLNDIKSKGIYFVKIYDAANNVVDTKKLIIN